MASNVLVCHAERHLSRLIEVTLQRQGHQVTAQRNGLDALAKLESEPFDLVVLGLDLPGADGCEVLRHIRIHEATTSLVVWMVASEREFLNHPHCGEHRPDRFTAQDGPSFFDRFR